MIHINRVMNTTPHGYTQRIRSMNSFWQALLLSVTLLLSGQANAAEAITFYHNDLLGSPVAVTDINGDLCWREDYRPYGEKMVNNDDYQPSNPLCGLDDNQRGYTNHVYDKDIGLTYMQARYYDPVVGRFMGIDPIGVRLNEQTTFNSYAYAANNPYKFIDPDGMAIGDPEADNSDTDNGVSSADAPGHQNAGPATDVYSYPNSEWRDQQIEIGQGIVDLGIEVGMMFTFRGLLKNFSGLFSKKVTKGGTTAIGRVKGLKNLKPGEKSLLDRLPDKGNPKANWKQNSGVLRQEMGKGKPIRDASPGDTSGQFLNAERNLLRDRSWSFDSKTNHWNPPKQ